MNDENLQLRNCADCTRNSGCDGNEPCEHYEYNADPMHAAFLDGWQKGYQAALEFVERKKSGDNSDPFDREEDAYND